MNTYYLVPSVEYTRQPRRDFDLVTENIVNDVGLGEIQRAQQLQEALNKLLNTKKTPPTIDEGRLMEVVSEEVTTLVHTPEIPRSTIKKGPPKIETTETSDPEEGLPRREAFSKASAAISKYKKQ